MQPARAERYADQLDRLDLALEALEQSLAIDPDNLETVYTKAPDLLAASADQVGADLAAVRAGGGCGAP